MELDEKSLTVDDWQKLEETAESIIKNSTRDLILWTEVLKHVRELKDKAGSVADGDIELPPGFVPG